jgi:mRNA interferase MazF
MKKKRKERGKQDEMLLCLCTACARQFYNSPEHVIRRANPNQQIKDTCNYCSVRQGFDYLISQMKGRS